MNIATNVIASHQSNLCHEYIRCAGKEINDFWMRCDSLACETKNWFSSRKLSILTIEDGNGYSLRPQYCYTDFNEPIDIWWSFHAVIVENNLVHDIWFPWIVSIPTYLTMNFSKNRILSISLDYQEHFDLTQNNKGEFVLGDLK